MLKTLCERALPHASGEDASAMVTVALEVSTELPRLCERYPVLPGELSLPVALTAAVQHRRCEHGGLLVQAGLMLWAFAFDDVLDLGSQSPHTVRQLLEECGRLAENGSRGPHPTHEVALPLRELLETLEKTTLWPDIRSLWCREFSLFLEASSHEYELTRGERIGPDATDVIGSYLQDAGHSIALPWLLIAGVALCEDASALRSLDRLYALAVKCGVAARLANDLGTFGRERAERRINAVSLLAPVAGDSDARARSQRAAARRAIQQRLEREVAEARSLASEISTVSSIEQKFLDVVLLGLAVYGRGDFRGIVGVHGGQNRPAVSRRGSRVRADASA